MGWGVGNLGWNVVVSYLTVHWGQPLLAKATGAGMSSWDLPKAEATTSEVTHQNVCHIARQMQMLYLVILLAIQIW